MKKALFIIALLTMTVQTAWGQDVIAGLTYNTEGGYYEINDAQDLYDLVDFVKIGFGKGTSGKIFKQTADIDLSGQDFPMIGESFQGTYDGQGYAITGLRVINDSRIAGFFCRTDYATLRNITLVEPTVITSFSHSGETVLAAGALLGVAQSTTIENCYVLNPTVSHTGAYSGLKYIGAIAGSAAATHNTQTNCYYYGGNVNRPIGFAEVAHTTRVGRARKITLGDGVCTTASATAPENGFRYDGADYYREDLTLPLALTIGETPEGYTLTYSANGNALSGSEYTVNASDGDASLTAFLGSDHQEHTVSYVDAGGTEYTTQAVLLDGSETKLDGGTYFVGHPGVAFDHPLWLDGTVTLILGDGCTMNFGTSENPLTGYCISYNVGSPSLVVYGQSLDPTTAGHLKIYTYNPSSAKSGIQLTGDYTQHSGNVTIVSSYHSISSNYNNITLNGGTLNTSSYETHAIDAYYDVFINGGQLNTYSSSAGYAGVRAYEGNIILGWRNPTDRMTSDAYRATGNVRVADGQVLTDENGHLYRGTLSIADRGEAMNRTLRPYGFDLTAREAPDGNYWTTFYCGTTGLDIESNACAYTATYSDGKLTLHNLGTTIPAATAVIIVSGSDVVNLKVNTSAPAFTGTNDLRGEDVDTPTSTLGDGTFYVLGNKNSHFGFHKYTGTTMAGRKAFILLDGGNQAQASRLTMTFDDDVTAISEALSVERDENSTWWYTLDGRRLQGKPTKSGMYISRHKKVIIK